jgi:SAM-dependent methyltransferase
MSTPPDRTSEDSDSENYERSYVAGDPPWDSGVPSAELVRVLEAGGLPGKTVLEIARRGYEVTGVDLSPTAVRRAREKAKQAGVRVSFRVGDILGMNLRGTYDVLFDRGAYHAIRMINLSGFLDVLARVTRHGTRWLCLAGNAKEPHEDGPPVVSEREFRRELEPLFRFVDVREFRFTIRNANFRPLAWSILMERK